MADAEWSPDSQFFIYSAYSSGGHQPWRSDVYFYNKCANKIFDFTRESGFIVADDEFTVAAPNIVAFEVYTGTGEESATKKSFKLDKVISDSLEKLPKCGENNEKAELYKVTLALKPNETYETIEPYEKDKTLGGSEFGDYLVDVLGFGNPNEIYEILKKTHSPNYAINYGDFFYSVTISYIGESGKNSFDQEYFVITNKPLDLQKVHDHKAFTVKVESANPELLPYIKDSDYCKIDADCKIRSEFCSYGAFNYFLQFSLTGFGCITTFYPDEDQSEIERLKEQGAKEKACSEYQEGIVNLEYKGAKCQQNKCVPVERIVKGFDCSP